jgi:integrase
MCATSTSAAVAKSYALDKWIYPFMGDKLLAYVNNRALKELVEQMCEKLPPASIRDYGNIVKAVVGSAIDENGEEVFPRKWNDEYIDAPVVKDQNQPSSTGEGITKIVKEATGQYRMLYALLSGCGPLRAGEALGVEIDKHISDDFQTIYVVQKAKRGEIQQYLKTKNGERQVDLCSALATMLRDFVASSGRRSGLLFQTSTGAQLLQSNTLGDSLHPILKRIKYQKGGFNIFRRFRLTHLNKHPDCSEALKHFWSGHAPKHVSERYVKLFKDRDFRLEWVQKIGLGFELPIGSIGELGVLTELPRAS